MHSVVPLPYQQQDLQGTPMGSATSLALNKLSVDDIRTLLQMAMNKKSSTDAPALVGAVLNLLPGHQQIPRINW